MSKFIKLTHKYCGKTFDPVIFVPKTSVMWVRNFPKDGDEETFVEVAGIYGAFAVKESVQEVLNMLNE